MLWADTQLREEFWLHRQGLRAPSRRLLQLVKGKAALKLKRSFVQLKNLAFVCQSKIPPHQFSLSSSEAKTVPQYTLGGGGSHVSKWQRADFLLLALLYITLGTKTPRETILTISLNPTFTLGGVRIHSFPEFYSKKGSNAGSNSFAINTSIGHTCYISFE